MQLRQILEADGYRDINAYSVTDVKAKKVKVAVIAGSVGKQVYAAAVVDVGHIAKALAYITAAMLAGRTHRLPDKFPYTPQAIAAELTKLCYGEFAELEYAKACADCASIVKDISSAEAESERLASRLDELNEAIVLARYDCDMSGQSLVGDVLDI